MESGAHGVLLDHVADLAVVELNLDPELVPVRDQSMEEDSVLAPTHRRSIVIQDHVQVCGVFILLDSFPYAVVFAPLYR